MLVLPPLVYWLFWCMEHHAGALTLPGQTFWRSIPPPTWRGVALFGGWFLFQTLLQLYAPGRWVEGQPLRDGARLAYRMNGWFSWWATWAVLAAMAGVAWATRGSAGILALAAVVTAELGSLLCTATLFALGLSVFLYFWGRAHPDDGSEELRQDLQLRPATLDPDPDTAAALPAAASLPLGSLPYHFFMGTALNPRTGRFDWKLFCEARPGLMGWVVLDVALAARQVELHGHLTAPMVLVCLFQFWYVADYYLHEEAILSTWDIKHENFGWMLAFGDLVWVPFTYSLQALYLVHHPHDLPVWALTAIFLLNLAGYVIFRGTNLQKHHFRRDPEAPLKWWGRSPESIQTSHGNRLLINGFWGWARHLNYLGDLMMGLAWCLLCGFDHLLPYFYITYFTILLLHRERRDDRHCRERYGEAWDTYTRKVRWRILPGIY